jgi:hypothetical protein
MIVMRTELETESSPYVMRLGCHYSKTDKPFT